MTTKQAMGDRRYTKPRCQAIIYPPWPSDKRQCANTVLDLDSFCRIHRAQRNKLLAQRRE